MASTRYFYGASQEEFPPEELLRQAVAAEKAGFDGISTSDHLQPWWEPGESGHTWVWLGAAGQATSLPIGTGVTSTGARYHPALIAQAWATLDRLFPGRPFLGIGSGEALNEVPVGDDWPSPKDQIARMEEALRDDRPPVEGRDDHRGRALLQGHRPEAPHAAERAPADLGLRVRAAGRRGRRPPRRRVVDAPRPRVHARGGRGVPQGAREAGKEGDGEIVFQALWSWAETDEAAFEAARKWKGAQPPDHYTRDWHKPQEMYEHGEQEMSDEEFAQNAIVGADPETHVERLKELEELGPTVIVLQNNSGADPMKAIEVYGEQVLPALRGARV